MAGNTNKPQTPPPETPKGKKDKNAVNKPRSRYSETGKKAEPKERYSDG